jgi:hypothetical protein
MIFLLQIERTASLSRNNSAERGGDVEKITSDLKYGISNIKKGGTCNLVIKSGGR